METSESSKKPTVLIVDDQPANIHALANIVREEYVSQVATNGLKAIEIASGEHPPDLILLDIMMPEMDGIEVCRRLKADENTRNIPVIFVTAKNSTSDEAYGFDIGAVDYISRPFNPKVVRVRVRNHINLKIKSDMMENLSLQDGLTNIPNRRFFDQQLQKQIRSTMRNRKDLSLLMIDIDNFKQYNDNYGHGTGDECLKNVAARILKRLKRPLDFVARYGGEEFVVLLPETPKAGAVHVAESIRKGVFGLNIPHEHSSAAPVVTVSIGTATCSHKTLTGIQTKRLLALADQALYNAKENGRNQVHAEML